MNRNQLIWSMLVSLLCVPFFGYTQEDCLFDWENKVPITIDNSGGDELTEYQFLLTVDTETPIGLGAMEPDGSDIRFSADGCCDPLCYYIESGINTASTEIWVRVPSIPAGTTTEIFMFFGNPGAPGGSDASCTFDFYEDFEGLYTGLEYLCGTVSDSSMTGSNLNMSWSSNALMGSTETFPFDEVYTVEAWMNSASGSWPAIYWAKSVSQKNYGLMTNGSQARISLTGGGTSWCSGHNWASGLFPYSDPAGLWSFTWIATGDLVGNFPTVGEITTDNSLYAKDEDLRIMIGGISSGSGSMNMDWLRVRKYAAVEPTFTIGIPATFDPAPPITLAEEVTSCVEATLDAGAGFESYEWNTGGTEQTETVDADGDYWVVVTDDEGCTQYDTVAVTIAPDYLIDESEMVCQGDSYLFPDGTLEENITETLVHTSLLTTEGFGCDSIIVTTVSVYDYSPVLDLGADITSCGDPVNLDAGPDFGSYAWNTGGDEQIETVDATGTYSVAVTDDNGCEQIDEVNVEIIEIDISLDVDMLTLTSNEAGADGYQWVDCDDDYAIIAGATAVSYEVTENGNYGVIITKGECVDTSECILVSGVGIDENEANDLFDLYPNPTTGQINLQFNETNEPVIVRVSDASGRQIGVYETSKSNLILDLDGADGIYFVEVTAGKQHQIVKVVKE